MFKPLVRARTVAALSVSAFATAPGSAQTGPATVVVEVALASNAAPSDASMSASAFLPAE